MNLFLIGFRCTGKTSVGQVLAQRLGWSFVDTDRTISAMSGCEISRMVDAHGWPFFREQERRLLERICAADRQVVATGGGIILDDRNVKRMRRCGMIVCLTAGPKTIVTRMRADNATTANRPPLTSRGVFEEVVLLHTERKPLYQKAADFTIDTDGETITALCERIEQWMRAQPVSAFTI